MSNIICIRIFGEITEAEIAKSFLIANDVQADIFFNSAGAYTPHAFPLGARLMINEEDKEKALELLESLNNSLTTDS